MSEHKIEIIKFLREECDINDLEIYLSALSMIAPDMTLDELSEILTTLRFGER